MGLIDLYLLKKNKVAFSWRYLGIINYDLDGGHAYVASMKGYKLPRASYETLLRLAGDCSMLGVLVQIPLVGPDGVKDELDEDQDNEFVALA